MTDERRHRLSDKDDTDDVLQHRTNNVTSSFSAPADITANAGDIYIVAYTLDGMVFRTQRGRTRSPDGRRRNFAVADGCIQHSWRQGGGVPASVS